MRRIARESGSDIRGGYDPDGHERLSFSSAVADFRASRDTPRAFLERCLEALYARESELRAFAYVDVEGARRGADEATRRYREGRAMSPVDGCPVAFKDTLETADMPTQQNSELFKGWIGKRDAACVWALRSEGAVILGKTQVPELALGKPPPTRNPFDARRSAGGSSSGSGAAVGAGMVPVAIGNQTMGSLIRPASYNANYGFKPTWGALNIGGMHPLAPSLDHIGPMAATLADMWRVAQRISFVAGGHNGHPGLTGGPELPAARKPGRLVHLKTLGWTQIDDTTHEAFSEMLSGLRSAGVEIVDERSHEEIAELERLLLPSDDIATDICMYELRWPMAAYVEAQGRERIGDAVYARLERGLAMTPQDYRSAIARRDAIRCKVRDVAVGVNGFISLASSGPAPMVADIAADTPDDRPMAHTATGSRSFLSPWSLVGGPGLALPWLAIDGMPLGVQLMGVSDTDPELVAIAHWAEQMLERG